MRIPILALALAVALLSSGCAYSLGSSGKLPYHFVFVARPAVETDLPELEWTLARALRRGIETQSKLKIAGESAADAILEVHVVSVERETAAAQFDDQGRDRKVALRVHALATLRKADGSGTYFENLPIDVGQDIFVDSGQTQAERQAGPRIAQAIAERVVESVVDAW